MKAPAVHEDQFLTDAQGKRTGVVLDLNTYARLREAEEELAEVQGYDSARSKALAEVAAGRFAALAEFRAGRGPKAT